MPNDPTKRVEAEGNLISLQQAADLMIQNHRHRVVVVDMSDPKSFPLGVISASHKRIKGWIIFRQRALMDSSASITFARRPGVCWPGSADQMSTRVIAALDVTPKNTGVKGVAVVIV